MDPIVILTHGKVADLDELTQAFADKGMQATVLNTATATLTDILAALAGDDDEKDDKNKEDEPEDGAGEDDKKKDKEDKPKKDDVDPLAAGDAGAGADDTAPPTAEETFEEGFQIAGVKVKAIVSERYKTNELHANFISVLAESGDSSRNTVQLDNFSEIVIYEDHGLVHAPLAYSGTHHAIPFKLVKTTAAGAVIKLSPSAFARFK
jgi:hypothetical protein